MSVRLRTILAGAAICALLLTSANAQSAPAPSQAQQSAGQLRVPILMYHYIRVNPVAGDLIGADLSVTPHSFADQMLALFKAGVHTITLDDVYAALTEGLPLPERPVILTFDDGYDDFYTEAYPILEALHMKATSFIITGKVGWKGYMTWDQLREIDQSGLVQFESHTVNHVELNAVSYARAEQELVDSKATLEKELGKPIKYLCYPSGRYNASVLGLAHSAGYDAAVTTEYGLLHTASDLYTLSRVRIHGAEGLEAVIDSVLPSK